MGKPREADRSTLTDAELLDALAYAGPGIWARLENRYNQELATPLLVRAALAVELPDFAIRRARSAHSATPPVLAPATPKEDS